MEILVYSELFTVCKLESEADIPMGGEFVFVGKTEDEISLVCRTEDVPCNTIESEDDWKLMRIEGVLDFSLIGVIADISRVLAERKIAVFVVSTYNTDYILVKENKIEGAIKTLHKAGYSILYNRRRTK